MKYRFATDSETGTIEAASFDEAREKLDAMVPSTAIADGAWGWVEDVDGTRYERGGGSMTALQLVRHQRTLARRLPAGTEIDIPPLPCGAKIRRDSYSDGVAAINDRDITYIRGNPDVIAALERQLGLTPEQCEAVRGKVSAPPAVGVCAYCDNTTGYLGVCSACVLGHPHGSEMAKKYGFATLPPEAIDRNITAYGHIAGAVRP